MLFPLTDTLRLLVVTRDRAARMNWTPDGPLVSDALVYAAPGPNSKLTLLAKPGKNEFLSEEFLVGKNEARYDRRLHARQKPNTMSPIRNRHGAIIR